MLLHLKQPDDKKQDAIDAIQEAFSHIESAHDVTVEKMQKEIDTLTQRVWDLTDKNQQLTAYAATLQNQITKEKK